MATNYSGLLYGPIFRIQSVAAHLAPRVGTAIDLRALDDTAGIEIEGAEVLLPVIRVRAADLAAAAITIDNLDKGTIALTDPVTAEVTTWKIDAARVEPTPSGRSQGLIMLMLERTA